MVESSDTSESKELPRGALPVLGLLAVAGLVLAGLRYGIGASILGFAALALLAVVGLAFRAVQSITEPDDDTLLVEDALSPAEAQKVMALRALKDLDYERSIGNVNDEDYRTLETQYREDAKRAMRAVDEERAARRARAEELAREALDAAARDDANEDEEAEPPSSKRAVEATPTPAEAPVSRRKRPSSATVTCAKCGTQNDRDAKFCKECAAKLEANAEATE